MYYVYILRSIKGGSYYVGSTQDVAARLNRHNSGGSQYTSNRGPWKLLYTEHYDTRSLAMKREKQIKGWKSKKCIEELIAYPHAEGRPD